MLASIDWQGIATVIAAVGAAVAAVVGALNRRAIGTPSGDPIGAVVERTHDLAAVATMSTMSSDTNPVSAGPGLDRAVERINNDAGATIKVNGETVHS